MSYESMRRQKCLSFISHQQDNTISQRVEEQQQIKAKPKNNVEVQEESVEAI